MQHMPFVLEGLLQQPDNMEYGTTALFYELAPDEQRKVLTLNQRIYQMSQLSMRLVQDIDALQSKQFYTVAYTKKASKATSNTVPMRYVEQMRGKKFTAAGEIALRKLTVDKYAKRIATLRHECLALYAKVDAELLMRMGHACYNTPEMHARFKEMSLGRPTSAEKQGRLTLEDVCYVAWDGVPRCKLKEFGRPPAQE